MLFELSEWQSPTGDWQCSCVSNLGHGSGAWYLPCRVLDLTPVRFIEFVLENFSPDTVYANKETASFFYSWKSQTAMRKFKNYVNKVAREKNFQI